MAVTLAASADIHNNFIYEYSICFSNLYQVQLKGPNKTTKLQYSSNDCLLPPSAKAKVSFPHPSAPTTYTYNTPPPHLYPRNNKAVNRSIPKKREKTLLRNSPVSTTGVSSSTMMFVCTSVRLIAILRARHDFGKLFPAIPYRYNSPT